MMHGSLSQVSINVHLGEEFGSPQRFASRLCFVSTFVRFPCT